MLRYNEHFLSKIKFDFDEYFKKYCSDRVLKCIARDHVALNIISYFSTNYFKESLDDCFESCPFSQIKVSNEEVLITKPKAKAWYEKSIKKLANKYIKYLRTINFVYGECCQYAENFFIDYPELMKLDNIENTDTYTFSMLVKVYTYFRYEKNCEYKSAMKQALRVIHDLELSEGRFKLCRFLKYKHYDHMQWYNAILKSYGSEEKELFEKNNLYNFICIY